MLIRSQSKKALVPIKTEGLIIEKFISKNGRTYHIGHKDAEGGEIFYLISGTGVWLGVYSTEEKAIKVLDQVQEYYINTNNTRCKVFQMPQDSEVDA